MKDPAAYVYNPPMEVEGSGSEDNKKTLNYGNMVSLLEDLEYLIVIYFKLLPMKYIEVDV